MNVVCIAVFCLYLVIHIYFYSTVIKKNTLNEEKGKENIKVSELRQLKEINPQDGRASSTNHEDNDKEKEDIKKIRPKPKLSDPNQFLTEEGINEYYSNALLPLSTIVDFWHPESTDQPIDWIDVVPRFDWNDPISRKAAQMVRESEKPFVMTGVPELLQTSKKWNSKYLYRKLSKKTGNVEISNTKSFMFWRRKGNARNGPTFYERMSWDSFLEKAKKLDFKNIPNEKHYYWHTSASSDPWIEEDLKMFDIKNDFFIVDKSEYNVPIACRIGTKGLCNENHYDTHRTFAAQIIGSKRWIFQPPTECEKMYLYPDKHISSRHSMIDINSGNINFTKYPKAKTALAIETVIHEGEIGYLPSNWFHHIISQEFNIQCIARSGHSLEGDDYIENCGFAGGRRAMGKPKKRKK